jgi:DNA modification methylase
MKGDTGGLLFRNQGRLSEIQRSRGKGQTSTLDGGLTFRTTMHPYDGAAPGAEAGYETGTSLFCPVLTELCYRWYCPPGGTTLDCFAGGSVRGIVAAKLGRRYVGIDLSERQVIANREQAERICSGGLMPEWRIGDSIKIDELASDVDADFILSCPPYGSLESYSEDPRDISTMSYDDFLESYRIIIKKTLQQLKQDRFACFVVGDFRGKDGFLMNFPGHTVQAFEDAGARLYCDAILVTATGSLPIRAGRAFASNRKLGRTHQVVYFFVKGSWKEAARACGDVDG